MSVSKFSGKPEDLPTQSWPDSADSESVRFVGPAPIGVFVPGVPVAEPEYPPMATVLVSVGKRLASLILLSIHC